MGGKRNDQYLEALRAFDEGVRLLEEDPKWRENNLEFDLRSTDWICKKAKDLDYGKRLYAALCNTQWQKNDVWKILKDEYWSCSWRSAGGIVADMIEQGDYMDWYCSGSEGYIHPEIAEDLSKLGWYGREWKD